MFKLEKFAILSSLIIIFYMIYQNKQTTTRTGSGLAIEAVLLEQPKPVM